MAIKIMIGKVLYALLFCLVLPFVLMVWAAYTPVAMPMGDWKSYGWIGLAIGLFIIIISMLQLWFQGKGLPMNIHPPEKYVATGMYFYFSHPIYVGFCICCFAVAAIAQSASGFYLVAPVMVLLCWALVKGFEEPVLKKRFDLRRNSGTNESVTVSQKIKVILPLFIAWVFGYEILVFIGFGSGFTDTVLNLEKKWTVVEWAEIPYASVYLLAAAVPWLIKTNNQLKFFQHTAQWTIFIGLFLQWLLPLYASPREFVPQNWLGDLILWERSMDSAAAAFPSFHALWALISAGTLTIVYPRLKPLWFLVAAIISWSCVAVGAHSLIDIIAAWVLYGVIVKRDNIIHFLNSGSERLANSWKAWQFKGLRIINHATYSAAAAFVGTFIVGQFIQKEWHVFTIVFGTMLGGMFWGQWVEGSSRMLRPFGYFGAILGGLLTTSLVCLLFDFSWMILIAAFALTSPWTQAIGRLRCLVQGCCHGSEANENDLSIRYVNEHSRVCAISGLGGKALHNTQGYSIIFNMITGLILFRLWYAGSSPALIAGLYFVLAGTSRFVEEQYRGEVQTQIFKGLRLYQWLALISILIGISLTMVNVRDQLILSWNFSPALLVTSCLAGLSWAFGMSMDFPKSTVRFSRLTG